MSLSHENLKESTTPFALDNRIKEIMSKFPSERTEEEISYMCSKLETMNFSQDTIKHYGINVLREVFTIINLVEIPPETVIIKTGDPAVSCYILLEGKLEMIQPEIVKTRRGSTTLEWVRMGMVFEGHLFGEKAILNKTKRSSTIKSVSACILGEITKKDYMSLFESSKKHELNDDYKFVKSLKNFVDSNQSLVERLTTSMEKKDCKAGEVIIKQGDLLENLYIVRAGCFNLLRKREINLTTEFDLNYFSNLQNLDLNTRFTNSRMHEIKGKMKIDEIDKILSYGPGEIFGDIEMINNTDISHFTFISVHTGQLLYCKRKIFSETLGSYLYEQLKETVKEKIETLKGRLQHLHKLKKIFKNRSEKIFYQSIINRVETNYQNYQDGKTTSVPKTVKKIALVPLKRICITPLKNLNLKQMKGNNFTVSNMTILSERKCQSISPDITIPILTKISTALPKAIVQTSSSPKLLLSNENPPGKDYSLSRSSQGKRLTISITGDTVIQNSNQPKLSSLNKVDNIIIHCRRKSKEEPLFVYNNNNSSIHYGKYFEEREPMLNLNLKSKVILGNINSKKDNAQFHHFSNEENLVTKTKAHDSLRTISPLLMTKNFFLDKERMTGVLNEKYDCIRKSSSSVVIKKI